MIITRKCRKVSKRKIQLNLKRSHRYRFSFRRSHNISRTSTQDRLVKCNYEMKKKVEVVRASIEERMKKIEDLQAALEKALL